MDARQGGRLENYANSSSPLRLLGASDLRKRRYERRGLLWAESALERCRKCGKVPHGEYVAVRHTPGGAAGFAGLTTCGSVWVCPVCNAKIMARRALEIGAAVATWQARGGAVAFGTFTMRHDRSQGLRDLWNALSKAWGMVTGGKQWIKDKDRYGIAGWLRAVEVTWGRNGWHVHVHTLVFLQADAVHLENLHARMFGRWSRSLVRQGLRSPLVQGQDFRWLSGPADAALAGYLTKSVDVPGSPGASAERGTGDHGAAIGLEVVYSQGKRARSSLSTQTPWALLDGVEQGDAASLGMWHEWERGSHNRQQLRWSKGLRELLAVGSEQSDEDIASEEHGSQDDDLVHITGAGWRRLIEVPADLAGLLTAVERGGLRAARAFLDARGVEYVTVGRAAA
jgi:hypothetical protein